VNRALASSAAFAASRGRMNTLGTDSMAAMDRISLEHLRAAARAGARGCQGSGIGSGAQAARGPLADRSRMGSKRRSRAWWRGRHQPRTGPRKPCNTASNGIELEAAF